jgi:hypothetical protein
MTRDRFKQTMFSPYFQSDHYKDSKQGQIEQNIENKIKNKTNSVKNFFNILLGKLF